MLSRASKIQWRNSGSVLELLQQQPVAVAAAAPAKLAAPKERAAAGANAIVKMHATAA